MKSLVLLIISLLCLKHLQTAPTLEENESTDSKKIKVLTKLGEEFVEQEVRNALLGIKEMKKIMETNEEKHNDILKSLRKTTEEKVEAVKLFEDINERLNDAEMQCSELQKDAYDECKACIERTCITLYTTTCSQQGLQSFTTKAQEMFKEWSPFTHFMRIGEIKDISKASDREVAQLSQADKSFNLIMSDVSNLFNESILFLKNAHQAFNQSFQNFFMADVMLTDDKESTAEPHTDPEIFSHWNISDWVQSFSDFSQAVFEGITDAVIKMFKDFTHEFKDSLVPPESASHFGVLKSETNPLICKELQNSTECLPFQERCQLCNETFMKDCPDLLELHIKSEVAFKLVNISTQQYEDLMHIVQQHTEDTADIMTQMKERFGWVGQQTNTTYGTNHIFSIDKVSFIYNSEPATVNETIIEVNVLSSPKFTIRVPGDIDLESPEFMKYVAEKALDLYKQNF
ncbi:clusterin-like protein 1 [Spea bombifrons]|uniref:clusterin-like protein 1 n=1 Tax=Spea bombifrons TaxID=233779 RepID=UPI00234AEA79|nr:clusterin-like protein 1 [Spea bombifrons]